MPSQQLTKVNRSARPTGQRPSGWPQPARSAVVPELAPATKATAAPHRSWLRPHYRGPQDLRLGPKGAARRRAHNGDDDRRRGRPEHHRRRAEAAAAFGSVSGKAYGAPNRSRLVALEWTFDAASIYGGGAARNGLERRRRVAGRTLAFGRGWRRG